MPGPPDRRGYVQHPNIFDLKLSESMYAGLEDMSLSFPQVRQRVNNLPIVEYSEHMSGRLARGKRQRT